jgi:hypothetical protein
MADKKDQKEFDTFEERVEHDRDAMAVPVKDREAFAVFLDDSGSYMLQGVFPTKGAAESHVRRILAKSNPAGVDLTDHVFIAELSEARSKYVKDRDAASKSDSKPASRASSSKADSDK